ncbi:MAG: heavy metal-responsive transcriptional regulator [Acidimicrobiia bacterium]|nr:heavy metal-responsive transcriptional regulator [Acidimicrobiia bacterium]
MRIGEVAERCGLPARTIRFYERRGLLPEPEREANGYRRYDPTVVDRVGFIRNAQAAGLTLTEIGNVLNIRDAGTAPCAHVTDLLETKHADLRDQIARLRDLERDLRALIERSRRLDPADCGSDEICHILQPDAQTTPAGSGTMDS